MKLFWLWALLLLTAGPGLAAVPEDDEQAAIARAEHLGRLIYDYDRAAWVATDKLMEVMARRLPPDGGGWTVAPHDGGLRVVFLRHGAGNPTGFFIVDTQYGSVVAGREPANAAEAELPSEDRASVSALENARKAAHFQNCGPAPFNTVVLPDEAHPGGHLVYFLTPQTQNGVFPAGLHYLVQVSARGEIVSQRAFTKSCIALSSPPVPAGTNAKKPVALMVTHLMDATPTEIHVFVALEAHLPLYVGTLGVDDPKVGQLWAVEGDRIRKLGPMVPPTPSKPPQTAPLPSPPDRR